MLQVTLSRAEKGNALTLAMIQALTTTFQEAAEDNGVLRIVLAADGKYFCAGVDLGADGGILEADAEAKNRQWLMLQSLFHSIERSPGHDEGQKIQRDSSGLVWAEQRPEGDVVSHRKGNAGR